MRSARSASHLAAPRIRGDVAKLAKNCPGRAWLQHRALDDRTGLAVGKIEPIVTIERIGLQNAGITAQMPLGMLPRPIARGKTTPLSEVILPPNGRSWTYTQTRPAPVWPLARMEVACRRHAAARRPRLALDQRVQRPQRRAAQALDLIGQSSRLSSTPPLRDNNARSAGSEADAGRTSRTGSSPEEKASFRRAARRHMEVSRRRDLAASHCRQEKPAREPSGSFPPARDDLRASRVDILAELRQPLGRAAARAALRRWDHDALTRQMIRERFSRRPLARAKDLDRGEGLLYVRRRAHLPPRRVSPRAEAPTGRAAAPCARSEIRKSCARSFSISRLRCAISARPCASGATAATAHAFAAASVRAAISAAFNVSMSSGSEERSASTNHMESQNRPFEAPLFAFLQPIFFLSDRRRTPCLLRHAPIDARH